MSDFLHRKRQYNLLGNANFSVFTSNPDFYEWDQSDFHADNVFGERQNPKDCCTDELAHEANNTTGWSVGVPAHTSISSVTDPGGGSDGGDYYLKWMCDMVDIDQSYIYFICSNLVPGETYQVSFWYKKLVGYNVTDLAIYSMDNYYITKGYFGSHSYVSEFLWSRTPYDFPDPTTDWQNMTYVFEARTPAMWLRFHAVFSSSSSELYIDNCIVKKIEAGWNPLLWGSISTLTLKKETQEGGNTKSGNYYCVKCQRTTTFFATSLSQSSDQSLNYNKFRGKTVTFGCWVKTDAVSNVRLEIYDGIVHSYSDYHSGSGEYEWLQITKEVSDLATQFIVYIHFEGTISDISYISQSVLVYGELLNPDDVEKRKGEIIRVNSLGIVSHLGLGANLSPYPIEHLRYGTYIPIRLFSRGNLCKGIKAVRMFVIGRLWTNHYTYHNTQFGNRILSADGNTINYTFISDGSGYDPGASSSYVPISGSSGWIQLNEFSQLACKESLSGSSTYSGMISCIITHVEME